MRANLSGGRAADAHDRSRRFELGEVFDVGHLGERLSVAVQLDLKLRQLRAVFCRCGGRWDGQR